MKLVDTGGSVAPGTTLNPNTGLPINTIMLPIPSPNAFGPGLGGNAQTDYAAIQQQLSPQLVAMYQASQDPATQQMLLDLISRLATVNPSDPNFLAAISEAQNFIANPTVTPTPGGTPYGGSPAIGTPYGDNFAPGVPYVAPVGPPSGPGFVAPNPNGNGIIFSPTPIVTPTPTPTLTGPTSSNAVTDDPAYLAILSQFKAWGMANIAADIARIRTDYPDIAAPDLLTLLRTDARYNQNYMVRFAGNKSLMDAGKPMLSESDYLKTESAYEKVFKAYNLPQFQNQTYYAKLIGNQVDSTEVGTRVSLGYNRLLHADPETLQSWKNFYPMLSTGDIVGAMLDPQNQLPELERKVTTAEVGGAALAQGLNAYAAAMTVQSQMYSNVKTGTIGAEAAVAAGENLTQAKADYNKIAKEVGRSEFLSSITPQLAAYTQLESEQANILGLASAQRKKEDLMAAEANRFLGQSGTYGSKSFGGSAVGQV